MKKHNIIKHSKSSLKENPEMVISYYKKKIDELALELNTLTKEKYILPYRQLEKPKTNFALSPMFVSIILVLASLYFGFISKKNNPWFDIISILFGVVGLIIVAL